MSIEDCRVRLVETVDDAAEFLRWLGERRSILAIDTETEGLEWWHHRIRLIQFGDADTAWCLPFEDWRGVARIALQRYEGPIVGHNWRFDHRMIERWADVKIDSTRCHDTMLAAQLLDPLGRAGLKPLAKQHIHPYADHGEYRLREAMAKGKWDWDTVPVHMPEYWGYGGLDTIFTARLYDELMPRLMAEDLYGLYELECAVSGVLLGMEQRGMLIDPEYTDAQAAKLEAYIDPAKEWCRTNYSLNPLSNDQLIARLQREGYTFTKRTERGKLACDEDVLVHMEHPLAQTALNIRKAQKLANTYLRKFLTLMDRDNVLHCGIRQIGARHGRMSIADPSLQNVPARDGPMVRNCFVAREGKSLLTVDYSQMEMRVFAHFAREEEMIDKLRQGLDLHTIVAQGCFNTDTPTKKQRSVAKNADFSKIYGAGAEKFAETAGISLAEGQAFYDTYDIMFPGVRRFANEVYRVIDTRYVTEGRAYVRTPMRRMELVDEGHEYAAVNYLVSGTCADVFKQAIVNCDLAGLGEYMLLPVHDEIVFEAPNDVVEEVKQTALKVMPDTESFSVPLTVDATGPLGRWGQAYE